MKRKYKVWIWMVLLTLLMSSLPSGVMANERYRVYSSIDNGFEICYPESWTLTEGFMGTVMTVVSPIPYRGSDMAVSYNVIVQDISSQGNYSIDQYTELTLNQLELMFTDPKIISVTDAPLGGIRGKEIIYAGTMGQFRLQWMCRFIFNNNKIYVITFGTTVKEFDKFKALGMDVMDSFELI